MLRTLPTNVRHVDIHADYFVWRNIADSRKQPAIPQVIADTDIAGEAFTHTGKHLQKRHRRSRE